MSDDIDRDENVITPEEFEKIEKEEGEEIPKYEEGKTGGKDTEKMSDIERLSFRLDKLESKMDMLNDLRRGSDERVGHLSEEIGEVRAGLLEKERTFNEIESSFKKMKDIFEEMKPEEFRKNIMKLEGEIEKNKGNVEKSEMKIDDLRKKLEEIKKFSENIKNIENLAEMSKKVKDQLSSVEGTKKYIDRIAGKIESIFSEFNERSAEVKRYVGRLEAVEDNMKDILKSLDILEVKMENVVTKDKNQELEKKIEEQISELKIDTEDKIYKLKDIIEEVISKVDKNELQSTLKKIKDEFETIQENLEKTKEEIKNDILNEVKDDISQKLEKFNEINEKLQNIEKIKDNNSPLDTEKIKNEIKDYLMKEIDKKISEEMSEEELQELQKNLKHDLNKRINEIENEIEKLNISKIKEKINQLEENNNNKIGDEFEELKENTRSLTKIISDFKLKFAELNQRVNLIQNQLRSSQKNASIKEELPPHIEEWIKENLKKGYSIEQIKKSLEQSGYDPSAVDTYIRKHI